MNIMDLQNLLQKGLIETSQTTLLEELIAVTICLKFKYFTLFLMHISMNGSANVFPYGLGRYFINATGEKK